MVEDDRRYGYRSDVEAAAQHHRQRELEQQFAAVAVEVDERLLDALGLLEPS